MKNPLVAQPRVNKLGHVVTKHVLSGPAVASTAPSMPAPSAASNTKSQRSTKKLKPPTPMQNAPVIGNHKPTAFHADERLAAALNTNGFAEAGPSDVEMFGLFSVVSPDNAMAFSSVGITNPDEAVAVLYDHGLADLQVHRRDMMDSAISKRVKPKVLHMLSRKYDISAYEEDYEVFLDAAVLAGSKQLQPRTGNGTTDNDTWLYDSLLRGEVSHDDVLGIGIPYLNGQLTSDDHIHGALLARHSGEADYSLECIKHVDKYNRLYGDFPRALELATKYGDEFLLGIKGLDGALAIERDYAGETPDYRRSLIQYQEEACRSHESNAHYRSIDTIRDFYEHGVPASYVNATYSEGIDTSDIIDAYERGIPEDYVASMLANGLDMSRIVAASDAEISSTIGDGWL